MGFPGNSVGKESAYNTGDQFNSTQVSSWVGKIPWRRERLHTPVFWPGEFHRLYSHGFTKSRTQLSDFHFPDQLYKLDLPQA